MNNLILFVGAKLSFKFEMNCLKPLNEWQTIWNEINLLRVKGMRKSKVWIKCNRINSDRLGNALKFEMNCLKLFNEWQPI